jgi:hypothetical protein
MIIEEQTMEEIMKKKSYLSVMCLTALLGVGCSSMGHKGESSSGQSVTASDASQEKIKDHVAEWPEASRKATDYMLNKYGEPDGITPDMLVWNNIGPFKRSIVYKEEVQHDFPKPHTDVLEHFVDYKAPSAEKVAAAWKFDGSVILERTKGEMSARCDREAMNYLALNLANEVIEGRKTVDEARLQYAREVLSFMNEKPGKMTQQLTFTPPSQAGEADVAIMDKIMSSQDFKQAEEAEDKIEDKKEE